MTKSQTGASQTIELVFFLEEQSAAEMLAGLLPRVLPGAGEVVVRYIVFEGKQDMEKQLFRRMRGYLTPGARFIIMRDQDSGDCNAIKKRLLVLCRKSQKSDFLVRIACHELESWFLADLSAVEKGLSLKGIEKSQMRQKFREPDALGSPKQELIRLTDGCYQEIGGSRAIGPHLDPDNTRSTSFAVFVTGIRKMVNF